jgi:YD repeat-containing protein
VRYSNVAGNCRVTASNRSSITSRRELGGGDVEAHAYAFFKPNFCRARISGTRRDRAPRFVAGARWTFAAALFVWAVALSSYAGTTTYTYDVHGRLITIATPNGTDQSITTNSYDNAGNRHSVVVTAVEAVPAATIVPDEFLK